MLDIIFILVFGRLQASGTLDFPDKLYPVWRWAAFAGAIYAVIIAIIAYVAHGTANLFGILFVFAIIFLWLASYFKLLRLTAAKPVLNRCIYWGVGIASAFLLPLAILYSDAYLAAFLNSLVLP